MTKPFFMLEESSCFYSKLTKESAIPFLIYSNKSYSPTSPISTLLLLKIKEVYPYSKTKIAFLDP